MQHDTNKFIVAMLGAGLLLAGGCYRRGRGTAPAQPASTAATATPSANQTEVPKSTTEVAVANSAATSDEIDLPVQEEFRRTFQLTPGSRVNVTRINGRLTVETTDGNTAEVYVVRSVRQREQFDQRKLVVKQEGDKLEIHVERNRDRSSLFEVFGGMDDERQRVLLKLPRQIEFSTWRINGHAEIGEIAGAVSLHGIEGNVKVARATGGAEAANISGNLELTLAQMLKGVEVGNVSGNVDLRFVDEVNARLEARRITGNISNELPNFVEDGEKRQNHLQGRLGTGGSEISIYRVNGNVRLFAAPRATVAKKTAK